MLLSSIVVLDQSHGIKHAHGICFSVMSLSQIIAGQLREVSSLLSDESSNLRKLVDTHRNHAVHAGRAQAGELRVLKLLKYLATRDYYYSDYQRKPTVGPRFP